MAPAYRNSRTSGRAVRDQSDHDVFSGLPIRHWRKQTVTVNPIPPKEESSKATLQNSIWAELPMPKDSHLLPPYSQALLRAARMGQVFRPPASPVEEDKEPGDDEDADGDIEQGYVATKWGVVPRHLEGPEPEFLAKRRKGLGSLYGAVSGAVGASNQMRKTKIKKTDSEGHEYILEALVPEGQVVEGEVAAESISLSEAPAPGTVVEGVGVVNADGVVIAESQVQPTPPNKRKPPPPKRKAKGPGRGRKKKVAFATGPNGNIPSQDPNGATNAAVNGEGVVQANGGTDQANGDGNVEMGEDSLLQEGEEGGEEGSEDDEEGEEGEDGDREDGELSPSPRPASASPSKQQPTEPEPERQPEPEPDPEPEYEPPEEPMLMEANPPMPEAPSKREPSSSPDLPLSGGTTLQPPVINVQPADSVDLGQSPVIDVQPAENGESSQPPVVTVEAAENSNVEPIQPVPMEDVEMAEDEEYSPPMSIPQLPQEPPIDLHRAPSISPISSEGLPPRVSEQVPPEAAPLPPPTIPETASIEEPPQPVLVEQPAETMAPAVEAELPVGHNPLEGLSEPQAVSVERPEHTNGGPEPDAASNDEANQDLHFTDGEEDLLGSLERHLDKRS